MKRRSGLIALMLVVLMLLQSVAYATEADLNAGTPLADYTLGDYIEDQEAAALAASGEASAEPTYLEQIAGLKAEAEAVDETAEDAQAQLADIYNRLMAVYAEAGSPSAETDPEIYNAVGEVVSVLYAKGYDPYAVVTTAAVTATITYGSNSLNVYFYDSDGNQLQDTDITLANASYPVESTGSDIDIDTIVSHLVGTQSGWTLSAAHRNNTSGSEVAYIRYSSSQGWRYKSSSYSNTESINSLYLVFEQTVTDNGITVKVNQGASVSQTLVGAQNCSDFTVYNSSGTAVSNVTVTPGTDAVTVAATSSAEAGLYTVQYKDASGELYSMQVIVIDPDATYSGVGSTSHIEIEVAAYVDVTIDGELLEDQLINITTSNTKYADFTVTAEWNGQPFTDFTYTALSEGNGSNNMDTVELTGTYPMGTKANPVIYTITLVKNVTFTLSDGREVTLPITLTVTTNYWADNNACPGKQGDTFTTQAGIDVPVSADDISVAITKGKLQIEKVVVDGDNQEVTTDTTGFQFTIMHNSSGTSGEYTFAAGQYAQFDENNAYTGAGSTPDPITVAAGSALTVTNLPVGTYKITEIQKDGYIITDSEGNETPNYTLDFKIETKNDSEVPIAVFTNKKLEDEAAISIRKVASGISTGNYPTPEVSIYELDADGNRGATALWIGSLTPNGSDTWYLPITLEAGKTYEVVETGHDGVTGYTCASSVSGGATNNGMNFTVTEGQRHDIVVNNVYNPFTSVTVTKQWEGNEADYGLTRPTSVTVQLYDGETASGDEVTLSETNNWTHTWENLPVTGTYTVQETNVPDGYTATVTGDATTSYTITNTLTDIDIPVEKVWVDTLNSAVRPTEISVTLTGTAGDTVTTQTATLNANNNWMYTWEDMPIKTTDGNVITYAVSETAVTGYTSAVTGNVTDGFEITNTLNTYSITLDKNVAGNMGDQNKAFTFTVVATDADGDNVSSSLTITGVTVTDVTQTEGDTTTVVGKQFSMTHSTDPIVISGIPYGATVTITEIPDGYVASNDHDENGATATFDNVGADGSVIFTNTKNQSVDTGVTLDTVPYLLLAAGAGLMMLAARRRRTDN